MTPTATYLAEENCLQELPQMEKPTMPIGPVHLSTAYAYERALAAYNAHLATLRKIPCDPSCKGLWQDQQKVVEGKDYEVRKVPCPYFEDVNDPVEYSDRGVITNRNSQKHGSGQMNF